jgi:hypothetical protein
MVKGCLFCNGILNQQYVKRGNGLAVVAVHRILSTNDNDIWFILKSSS